MTRKDFFAALLGSAAGVLALPKLLRAEPLVRPANVPAPDVKTELSTIMRNLANEFDDQGLGWATTTYVANANGATYRLTRT